VTCPLKEGVVPTMDRVHARKGGEAQLLRLVERGGIPMSLKRGAVWSLAYVPTLLEWSRTLGVVCAQNLLDERSPQERRLGRCTEGGRLARLAREGVWG
jgi:hypothetical protein